MLMNIVKKALKQGKDDTLRNKKKDVKVRSNERSSSVYKPDLVLNLGGGQHVFIYPLCYNPYFSQRELAAVSIDSDIATVSLLWLPTTLSL